MTELWDRVEAHGDPLHGAAADNLVDLQDEPADECAWDLRALDAAGALTAAHAAAGGVARPVTGLYASSRLIAKDAYRKTGDPVKAHAHLSLGLEAASGLPDNGSGNMIRAGLERLAQRLAR